MKETKHERFCRVVEKRMAVLIDDMEKLGNCSARVSYDYTPEEVQQIIAELEFQVERLKKRFSGKRIFSLRDTKEHAGEKNVFGRV